MGMLSKLGNMIPPNAAQDTADTFLMGVGGGALGGLGATMTSGDDAMVPGMIAGFGGGVAARGAQMGIKQLIKSIASAMKQKMPDAPDNEIMMNAQRVVQDAMNTPEGSARLQQAMEVISSRGDDGQMHNYLVPRRK
jgi:hypothetical protein